MALSEAFLNGHIAEWEARFAPTSFRRRWPSKLFHHSPLENTTRILQTGQLLSRNDSKDVRVRDIAGEGVISARVQAHDYVRLYFRPRTPTQWHIEGIRKPEECTYGQHAHAPMLFMLVFDARQILMTPGVMFSAGNMQAGGSVPGDSEEFFASIPFDKVYHDSGTGGDSSITYHRCAEVLARSPVSVYENVPWIYCRSDGEKETLLHELGEHADTWDGRIVVSDDLNVFTKRFAYIETLSLSSKGPVVRIHPRMQGGDIDLKATLTRRGRKGQLDFHDPAISPRSAAGGSWILWGDLKLKDGDYKLEVKIENQLAYRNRLVLDAPIF